MAQAQGRTHDGAEGVVMRWISPRVRGNPIQLLVSENEVEVLIDAVNAALSDPVNPYKRDVAEFDKMYYELVEVGVKAKDAT